MLNIKGAARHGISFMVLVAHVHAQEAVNKAASRSDFDSPVVSKADIIGTANAFGDADLVNAPKWAQWTSLGLAVWRMLVFAGTVFQYLMVPVLYMVHILHSVLRPITLLIQLLFHILVGIPLSVVTRLSATLYPAYLFLGSAAIIGLSIGLGIAIFSRTLRVLLPEHNDTDNLQAYDTSTAAGPSPNKRAQGKQKMAPVSVKRSPPSTRSIMSSQPSTQTPTIFEESELSSYDDEAFNTDSDNGGTPIRSFKGYLDFKPAGSDSTRRRNF
ncbi:protein of unknown function [Taphrina deformans PYCC 5710]|uniref:TRP C-terminal domain-containing protein n=1 Tax=Taphrina deformans (strain PYCC 5710 / ATCC 11124 / CBS 356.35 / IMI 108563 / JCM 9778 / NBRC 8474) TaxID=1097556 RepID=R4XFM4_TAPDE|nr:protein of unknown function [Taphrina deformans PYCC 5710]|eukprot:CCG84561.1 protein of unknown function [Taphrina deformans PYCC 5710]